MNDDEFETINLEKFDRQEAEDEGRRDFEAEEHEQMILNWLYG